MNDAVVRLDQVDDLRAALEARAGRGAARVRLAGASGAAEAREAVQLAVSVGLAPELIADGAWLVQGLSELKRVGLAAVVVPVASLDGPGAATLRDLAGVEHLRVVAEVALSPSLWDGAASLAALCARVGAMVRVRGEVAPRELPRARAFLDGFFGACGALGVEVRGDGLVVAPGIPGPASGDPPRIDPATVTAVRADLFPASWEGGLSAADVLAFDAAAELVGSRAGLTRLLGARGAPVLQAPWCEGGLGHGAGPRCAQCPGPGACGGGAERSVPPASWRPLASGARVCVVAPFVDDRILLQGTLPGLVRALRQRGVDARLASSWERPFNPHAPDDEPPGLLTDGDEARHDYAKASQAAFVRGLDLSDADLVVVPGWTWGERLLRHPTLPPHARVLVADLHLMEGVDRWKARYLPAGARSLTTSWWPDARVEVLSCFPRYARLLWYAGVPLEQVTFRPYPIDLAAFPEGPPPSSCATAFAGGNHLRDHDTLVRAAQGLPDDVGVVVCSHRLPRTAAPQLLRRAPQPLPGFRDLIAASRFVVLPLQHIPDRAAGISVLAMAIAAGRPVVATAIPATLDHLTHEVDALLVPEGDADALQRAMRRLFEDGALCDRLGREARRTAQRASVEAWADALVHGDVRGPAPHPVTGGAPFKAW